MPVERAAGLPCAFIAGAPKCGTTSLSTHLAAHPQVAVSIPKEPFYFATDMPSIRVVDTLEDYRRLFAHAGPQARCLIDASPLYLYSASAAREILALNPQARFIVMLRNPVDLAVSFHAQCLFSHLEDRPDFREAWDLQDQRRQGRRLPDGCRTPELLQYRDVASLGTQLERLLDLCPREQVLTLLLEELQADPRRVYLRVLDFLGLADDGRRDFPRINVRKEPRLRIPAPLLRLYFALRGGLATRPGFQRMVGTVKSLAARPIDVQPLDPRLRAGLVAELRPERERLARLLGRNLDHWI